MIGQLLNLAAQVAWQLAKKSTVLVIILGLYTASYHSVIEPLARLGQYWMLPLYENIPQEVTQVFYDFLILLVSLKFVIWLFSDSLLPHNAGEDSESHRRSMHRSKPSPGL